jgi:hypothetical protein
MNTTRPIKTPKQRLVIYEELLERVVTHDTGGTCIRLKEMIGVSFHDNDYPETGVMFPEFGKHIDENYNVFKFGELCGSKTGLMNQAWRIAVLKNCIKMCKKANLK